MNPQKKLAHDMVAFLDELPRSAELDAAKDFDYLYFFEAERIQTIGRMLLDAGVAPDEEFDVLDFGYLHGLVPEFIHRQFPKASFTVCDRPASPIFTDTEYLKVIRRRSYLKLMPVDIADCDRFLAKFRVILLGEIIEHMDPTFVADIMTRLRHCASDNTILVITTPNGAGFYNSTGPLVFREPAIKAPIPDPMMGYPHIHLWDPRTLSETLRYCGWSVQDTRFRHGRENEMFKRSWRHWGSLKHQVYIKTVQLLTEAVPRWRGFFVLTASPTKKSSQIT